MASQDAQDSGRSPITPTTAFPDEFESQTVSASLASRRRRRRMSLFETLSGKATNVQNRLTTPHTTEAGHDEDTDEEQDRIMRSVTADLKRYKDCLSPKIRVLREEHEEHEEQVDEDGEAVTSGFKQEYVWDVMFENQRGIHLLGKAYFSSRTLLPTDPSPFTVPSHFLPSTTSFVVSEPGSSNHTAANAQTKDKESLGPTRSIRTAYTLQTYQTPSPAWTWMTPWMVNMRTGTDESGWRYNGWFKHGGWKSHAGAIGWNGWARRREWVRLRCIVPTINLDEQQSNRQVTGDLTFKEVVDGGVGEIVKVVGGIPLDRAKLDTWRVWLDKSDEWDRRKLQDVLNDETVRIADVLF